MLSKSELLKAITSDIEDELKAIQKYEEQLNNTDNTATKEVLNHVIAEEREHAELFTDLFENLIDDAESSGMSYSEFSSLYKAEMNSGSGASGVYLVRHAETDFNDGDATRIRSVVDLPLDQDGLLQANATGIDLRNSGIGCIYTSDMKRAKQTARAIELNTGAQVERYPQFRAWNLGSLAGRPSKDVEDVINDLVANPDKLPPDSNESYNMFVRRNLEGYKSAIQFNGIIAIVTHQSNCIAILDSLGIKDTNIEPAQCIKLA